MYCEKCGQQNNDSAKFCSKCGAPMAAQPQQTQQPQQGSDYQAAPATDNSKLFNILSYIGILWLFGLLVGSEKNKPEVRFHVGQGIMLTIVSVGLNIVGGIVTAIISAIFGFSTFYVVAMLINRLIWLVIEGGTVALTIIGITNASKGVQKPLPIIGRYAFYK